MTIASHHRRMILPLIALVAASPQAQAFVTIRHAARASASDWTPATNPRQREIVRIEAGQRLLVRVTDHE